VAGDIAASEKNYPKAIQLYGDALDLIRQAGIGYESSSLHYRLGFAYLAEGDIMRAEAAFNQLLTSSQSDVTIEVLSAEYGLARVAQQKGEISKARTVAHEVYKHLSEMDYEHRLLKEIEEFLDGLPSVSAAYAFDTKLL
jgi:tetratricopeptide (TPR) repeat protein